MAKFVFKDASITVNGVNLSDHANQVTVEDSAAEVDLTGFTSAGYSEFGQGLKDASITVTFFQDYASGSVDATLATLYSGGSAGTVVVKPTSATVSGTNPTYTMTGRLFSYAPIGGAVGDAAVIQCVFRHSGTAGVVRATV
jgi:hypothetical protein